MGNEYAIEQKYFAVGREATKGTAVAPSVYLPVKSDSELEYKLMLAPDEQVRGLFEKFPSKAGIKTLTGKLSAIDVDSDNIGLLVLSLLGQENVTPPTTGVYLHKFTNIESCYHQTLTGHFNRGLSSKQYPNCVIKSMAIKGTPDGKVQADFDVLGTTETTETFTLSPTWTDPTPFMFFQTQVSFGGTADTSTIKDWNVMVDNQAFAKRVLNQSQDAADILCVGKQQVTGGFTAYFEDEIRRAVFLAGTSAAIQIKCTGAAIGSTGFNYELIINVPRAMYSVYPFGDVDGLLGAAVTFEGDYDIGVTNESVDVQLQNTTTSYALASSPTLTTVNPTGGTTAGDTPVELTGTGFVSGATVEFGTTPALEVEVINATKITCVTPGHSAGAVGVTVSNPDGGTATKAGGYTYA